jgi:hypothetical protein
VRTTRIVVLRLLVDPQQGHTLQGALQLIPEVHWHTFEDGHKLLSILERIVSVASPEEDEEKTVNGQEC